MLKRKAYQKLLDGAMPLIDFKLDIIRRTYDLNSVDGKRKYTMNAVRVIRESTSAAEQEDLLKIVRDLTGTTIEALKRDLYSLPEKEEQVVETVNTPQFTDDVGDKTVLAARFVLASYLFGKRFAEETDVRTLEFTLPVHKEIKSYITDKLTKNEKIKFNELYEILPDVYSEELSRIAGLETDENKKFDQMAYFYDCVRTLKKAKISREIERLTALFSAETDNDKRRALTIEMAKLLAEKNKY